MCVEYSDTRTLLTRTAPLTAAALAGTDLTPDDITVVELARNDELYSLIAGYVVGHSPVGSVTFNIGRNQLHDDDSADSVARCVEPGLGLGMFKFEFDSQTLYCLHQTVGEVVGTDCGAALLRTLCLIAPGRTPDHLRLLTNFAQHLIDAADHTTSKSFTIWRYNVRHEFWRHAEVVKARSMESVVLPKKTKDRIVDDLDDFVAKGTRSWYIEHGIPYKRSFLLHGKPGAGKTSLIQAIAGRYGRNLAYLSPSHPDMTDDSLKAAVQRCPAKSIIVLEDVDALFAGGGRKKKEGDKSALTFSGVLNALDGVGACSGAIFILTTNHRENLDAALIRNGRVDVHVEFTDATDEQMRGLFLSFYKEAPPALAEEFATALRDKLGERSVSMAALQHFFILMRKQSAEEAVASAGKVVEEMESHGQMQTDKAKAAEADKADTSGDEKKPQGGKAEGGDGSKGDAKGGAKGNDDAGSGGTDKPKKGGTGKAVHVHVHIHDGESD